MPLTLSAKYLEAFVAPHELDRVKSQVYAAHLLLHHAKLGTEPGAGSDFLGWVDLPENYDREEFERVKLAAKKISENSDVVIVIGIGGSYLGARAAIEFCRSPFYNNLKKDTPDIYFSGNNISADYINELISICEGKDVSLIVISKSGTTTEPALAFRIFRELLTKKYGADGLKDRIYCVTDKARGTLKQLADLEGYESFVIPDDVGGRFSVLTPVGLLPIAIAGIDIDAMMQGAIDAREAYAECDLEKNDAYRYAAYRN
ncbi:MAG: glucose-6-phosphate isomerase, partial [Oscillospiraceae bacterium]|nr:glucose-6-phosphate isomerase [Oscillospiraceae bacterium]